MISSGYRWQALYSGSSSRASSLPLGEWSVSTLLVSFVRCGSCLGDVRRAAEGGTRGLALTRRPAASRGSDGVAGGGGQADEDWPSTAVPRGLQECAQAAGMTQHGVRDRAGLRHRGRLGDAFCLGSSSGGGAEVEKTVSVGEGPLESPALDATEKQLAVAVGGAAGRGSGVRSRKGTPGVRGHLCTACRSLVACR